MSSIDEQRALLDSLMGLNRNQDRGDLEIKDFKDERVCKFYLVGMCPHDMLVNTKADEGSCSKLHSDSLKEDFEKQDDPYMFDSFIEREFSKRIVDIDRTIKRSRSRVEEVKGDESINSETNTDILRIQADIERLTSDAESAAENGDIDKAQEIIQRTDALNQEKADILARIAEQRKSLLQRTGVDVNKKLRVCDVCGSFLSILDSDQRLADHFMGKQHSSFQLMREYIEGIKTRREEKRTQMLQERQQQEGTSRSLKENGSSSISIDDRSRHKREYSHDDHHRRDNSRERTKNTRRGDSRERNNDRRERSRDRSRRESSRERERERTSGRRGDDNRDRSQRDTSRDRDRERTSNRRGDSRERSRRDGESRGSSNRDYRGNSSLTADDNNHRNDKR